MKISEVTCLDVADYLRLNDDEKVQIELPPLMTSTLAYIKSYTGLSEEEIDEHEDLTIAFLIICGDFYDNRSLQADKKEVNRTVESILNMHTRNLVG